MLSLLSLWTMESMSIPNAVGISVVHINNKFLLMSKHIVPITSYGLNHMIWIKYLFLCIYVFYIFIFLFIVR